MWLQSIIPSWTQTLGMAELFNPGEKRITRGDGWDLTPGKFKWEMSYKVWISEKRLTTRINKKKWWLLQLLTAPNRDQMLFWVCDGGRQFLGLCQRGHGQNPTVRCQQRQLTHLQAGSGLDFTLLHITFATLAIPLWMRQLAIASCAMAHSLLPYPHTCCVSCHHGAGPSAIPWGPAVLHKTFNPTFIGKGRNGQSHWHWQGPIDS